MGVYADGVGQRVYRSHKALRYAARPTSLGPWWQQGKIEFSRGRSFHLVSPFRGTNAKSCADWHICSVLRYAGPALRLSGHAEQTLYFLSC